MNFILVAINNITLISVILITIYCPNPTYNSQQSKTIYSDNKAGSFLQEDNATKSLITEGSSTTDGYGVTNEYPKQLAVLLGGNYYKQTNNLILNSNNSWSVRNVGDGGDTMVQMTAQYNTQVLPFYNPSLNVNYLTLQAGSNDVANGRTTEALKNDVAVYVAKAKADGFIVGVCTIFHRVGNDVAKVSDYNNWLRAGNSGANFIVDLAAHPSLSDATNRTYFIGDGIHTNNAGQAVITSIFADAIPITGAASIGVTIEGRVLTANGRGVPSVELTLTDAVGNTKKTRTSTFGYYRFKGIAVRQTYSLSAKAKRFIFNQPVQVLSINEDTTTINFIANP